VLRTKVRRQLALERQRYQEEMLNPGRLITVKREGYEGGFQSNGRKIVQWREPSASHAPDGFFQDRKGVGGPLRNKFKSQRSKPYKSLRC
jgi:hypothetical protein